MKLKTPRLAVRAIIVWQETLLLVNAYPGRQSDLWCAPGGGVEPGQSLPDNLAREVTEETGLAISVGAPCLINEFHHPDSGFHQVEVFFRASVVDPTIDPAWQDPEGVVADRRWVTRADYGSLRVKPDSLGRIAWDETASDLSGISYDALERIVS